MAITTAEQLLRAGDIGRCELVRGELRTMIPPGSLHGRIAAEVAYHLALHIKSNRLGTIYAAETGFLLSREPDTVRAPDFAFVRAGRPPAPERGYYPRAPDLAVEVLSPDDRPGMVREKVAEWLEAGALAVWVVDPRTRSVTIHEPDRSSRTFRETDVIPGGDLLPGLQLAVRELFD
ncbi:MAG: Uma2 family endonuclease [Planctomycetota bacterium]|jgi:Uma2 family endonuclease